MKLYDKRYEEFIKCSKCAEDEFTDFDKRTETTTYHIWCKKKDCKTDLLIPVKDIIKEVIEIK